MNKTMDIFEQYQVTNSLDELWSVLHRQLSQYGVTSIFYGLTHSHKMVQEVGMINAGWFKSSYPEEYLNYFDDNFNIDDDLCAAHCMNNIKPIVWHNTEEWGEPTEQQTKFMLDSIEFDMGVGVSIPLRYNNRGIGGIGLNFSEISELELNKIWASKQDEILTISHMFDEFARDEHMDEIYSLTPREVEVLTWLTLGKSTSDISKKLGNASSTVEKQVRSARKKLNARNNEQAVTKALILGLINP